MRQCRSAKKTKKSQSWNANTRKFPLTKRSAKSPLHQELIDLRERLAELDDPNAEFFDYLRMDVDLKDQP